MFVAKAGVGSLTGFSRCGRSFDGTRLCGKVSTIGAWGFLRPILRPSAGLLFDSATAFGEWICALSEGRDLSCWTPMGPAIGFTSSLSCPAVPDFTWSSYQPAPKPVAVR